MSAIQDAGDLVVIVDQEGDRVSVSVAGEIDLATAPRLQAYLDGVAAAGRSDVVLDLSSVLFMDSTGLGVMLRAARDLSMRNAKLVLRAPSAPVRRVLEVSGVSRFLTTEP